MFLPVYVYDCCIAPGKHGMQFNHIRCYRKTGNQGCHAGCISAAVNELDRS